MLNFDILNVLVGLSKIIVFDSKNTKHLRTRFLPEICRYITLCIHFVVEDLFGLFVPGLIWLSVLQPPHGQSSTVFFTWYIFPKALNNHLSRSKY